MNTSGWSTSDEREMNRCVFTTLLESGGERERERERELFSAPAGFKLNLLIIPAPEIGRPIKSLLIKTVVK